MWGLHVGKQGGAGCLALDYSVVTMFVPEPEVQLPSVTSCQTHVRAGRHSYWKHVG
jgi:hypothetical protein